MTMAPQTHISMLAGQNETVATDEKGETKNFKSCEISQLQGRLCRLKPHKPSKVSLFATVPIFGHIAADTCAGPHTATPPTAEALCTHGFTPLAERRYKGGYRGPLLRLDPAESSDGGQELFAIKSQLTEEL